MSKNYTVIQDGIKECGSACLLSIIRYYGGNVSINSLNELTKTNKNGTNFYNLTEAAKEIGLTGKAYKLSSTKEIIQIDKPFISQVVINNYTHFVVVYKISDIKITIMDPAKGMVSMIIDEFNDIWTGYILTLEPYKRLPIYDEDNYLINIIEYVIYNNKKMIINILIETLIVIIFTCAYSYYFKIIIDNVVNTNKQNLLIVACIFTIILLIKLITEYLRNNLILYLNQKLDLSIITSIINKIISLPYSYYKNKSTGEVISRINDALYIKNIITKILTTVLLDTILSLVVLIVLFSINITMTSLLLLLTILYFLVLLIYKDIIKNETNYLQEDNAKVNSLLVESINGYETIKGLNLETRFKNKINKNYLNMINSNLALTKTVYSSELIKDIFEGIIIILIILIGGKYIMDKSLSVGNLITYNTLIYYYINGIRNLSSLYKEYYYAKNSLKRINTLLDYKHEKMNKTTNLNILGDIKINNLTFGYDEKHLILKNITIDIPKSTKLLILGSSGSGKSTLLKILYKYYQIERDKISINNYDINDYSLLDIRKNITYISQNEFLYSDTIKNNIILDREVSEEEFLKICNLTYVTDIIKNNPLSYNMRLEENGINISGGERQRIILARALLKPAKIILIDEGLNEIDINLERKILTNIFKIYFDKTIIIISHRLENISLYDKIINLENGSIKGVYLKHRQPISNWFNNK